jgi:hypothetical protein
VPPSVSSGGGFWCAHFSQLTVSDFYHRIKISRFVYKIWLIISDRKEWLRWFLEEQKINGGKKEETGNLYTVVKNVDAQPKK